MQINVRFFRKISDRIRFQWTKPASNAGIMDKEAGITAPTNKQKRDYTS